MKFFVFLSAVGLLMGAGCHKNESPAPTAATELSASSKKQGAQTASSARTKTAQRPANPQDDKCQPFFDEGTRLFGEKKLDAAAEAFAKGYKECGPGFGFLQAQGFILAEQGKFEEAANFYLKEASEPGPKPEAFGNLERVRDKLSAATKAKIVGMGAQASNPVYVNGVRGEYTWARAFTCMGAGNLLEQKQSIDKGPMGQMIDKLSFKCPDGSAHTVFFDYGTDPAEAAYLREREAIDKGQK